MEQKQHHRVHDNRSKRENTCCHELLSNALTGDFSSEEHFETAFDHLERTQ